MAEFHKQVLHEAVKELVEASVEREFKGNYGTSLTPLWGRYYMARDEFETAVRAEAVAEVELRMAKEKI